MALTLEQRYRELQERIATACQRHGREPGEVRLLAVSKTFPVEPVRQLFELGQLDFGENYVQEGVLKADQLPGARWHLIGPLQSNKARLAVDHFHTFHALDRLELALRLERLAGQRGKKFPCFLQVRLGDEESKSGLDPTRVVEELEGWPKFTHLQLIGLMTLPPPHQSRPHFAHLRQIGVELRQRGILETVQLSMGMSDDFEDAIAEGSHWIRVGRALFGSR